MKTLPITCESFGAWLDEGRPAGVASRAEAHAASCERCREALAADRALDGALASFERRAPAGFTDHVMHAVEVANQVRARAPLPAWTDAMPWWSRAAMSPPTLGAATLAALLMWRPGAIEQGGRVGLASAIAWGQSFEALATQMMGSAGATIAASPVMQMSLAGAGALLLAVAALPLYRWTEKVALRGV